jgi:hypothetical protein
MVPFADHLACKGLAFWFYFSTSSYITGGYGDVVLPRTWRTVGPVESVDIRSCCRVWRPPKDLLTLRETKNLRETYDACRL